MNLQDHRQKESKSLSAWSWLGIKWRTDPGR